MDLKKKKKKKPQGKMRSRGLGREDLQKKKKRYNKRERKLARATRNGGIVCSRNKYCRYSKSRSSRYD